MSEERAFEGLSRSLKAESGTGRFVILTNVAHAVSDGGQPDEIDMVVVGPTGVHVIEVKHWDRSFVRSKRWAVEREADRITQKARRIGTKLRSKRPELRFVSPKILFTKEPKTLRPETEQPVRGVRLYGLADWRSLIDLDSLGALPDSAIDQLCDEVAPRSRAVLTGDLRRLGPIADMTMLSAPEERFHRIYRGRSVINQERLVVHVYDLTASDHQNPEHLARTEFEVVQRLQKSPWLPGLVDSFQEVPNYPGELFFFSVADSDAPSLGARASDLNWLLEPRIEFSRQCLIALEQLHSPPTEGVPGVIHRTITPAAILVRPSGEPLFFHWAWAKLPERLTIAVSNSTQSLDVFSAPEVRTGGLALADRRSDVFALCASLLPLFEGDSQKDARNVAAILSKGTVDEPGMRPTLSALAGELEVFGIKKAGDIRQIEEIVAPALLWAEGSTVQLDGHSYRVVGKLGFGGAGETFKIVQLETVTTEEFGTYVAKIVSNPALGSAALRAYMHARPHTKQTNLARIYSTAVTWQADAALALLEWVEGTPIGDYAGVIELYAEELGENEFEALVLTWINELCNALATLHAVGLIHGDVSPSNIIVNGSNVTLIDYDLVTRIGQVAAGTGTPPFSSPNLRDRNPVSLSDDLFALGATIFYILADRDPFIFDGIRAIDRGLAWTADLRQSYPSVARFLDRAVSLDPSKSLADAGAAASFISEIRGASTVDDRTTEGGPEKPLPLTPNEVPWLKEILKAYPGSRYGNIETRGLDSEFSERTYVETGLDAMLCQEIGEGRVSLVILCGNAGDGKTAFLQHLAIQLGLQRFSSSQRVWETRLANGITVKANLDGAAAWRGRSADDLLDEIFAPFHDGVPKERIVHLVAVNDGRLMEWIESYELRHGPSRLTNQLDETLGRDSATLDSHVRLIELNLRSLVGGFSAGQERISTKFLDNLFTHLVGGEKSRELWRSCISCSAQLRCGAWRGAQLLGAGEDRSVQSHGALLRERLTIALQMVHQRNEVHITTRELKGTLSYILFGTHYCTDLHNDTNLVPEASWDLAFDPDSSLRQGEVLRELARLDPALEAHPRIDRYLLSHGGAAPEHGAPRYPDLTLKSARRRAYFEWSDAQIAAIGGSPYALGLARGEHFRSFRDFSPLPNEIRDQICRDICAGLSRLEDVPAVALRRTRIVPIRIVPRTPTETAFWVEKELDRFHLVPEQFATLSGLETLHRHLILTYTADDGRTERLMIPLELFTLLMDLKNGGQLLDVLSDDVFANLGVFTQRLAQENERRLLAWNPLDEDGVHEIGIWPSNAGQLIRVNTLQT